MGSKDTAAMDKVKNIVTLIPWDTENEAQNQRLFDQRVACTWGYEEVDEWKETVRKGVKLMYWIVSNYLVILSVLLFEKLKTKQL